MHEGYQQERQADGKGYEDDATPIARPGDAGFLETVLACASPNIPVSRRCIVASTSDKANLLIPVITATTSLATGLATDWTTSLATSSSASSRIVSTSSIASATCIASTPTIGTTSTKASAHGSSSGKGHWHEVHRKGIKF